MPRRSKLTPEQWEEIENRHIKGESLRSLAKEFGMAFSGLSARISARATKIKEVANQLVAAETSLHELPISARLTARALADDLKAISVHLVGAARFGAATAHRLNGIANAQAEKVDDADPEKSIQALANIGTLGKLASLHAEIGTNLLAANKDNLKVIRAQSESMDASGNPITPKLPQDPSEQDRIYREFMSR